MEGTAAPPNPKILGLLPPRGASATTGSGPCSWLPKKFGLRRREEKRAKSPAQSGHRVWNVKNPGEQNQGVDGTTKIKIKNKQRSVNENQEEGQGAPPQKKGAELPAPPLLPAGPVRGLLLLHLQPAAAALVQPGQLEIPAGRGGPEHPEVAPST